MSKKVTSWYSEVLKEMLALAYKYESIHVSNEDYYDEIVVRHTWVETENTFAKFNIRLKTLSEAHGNMSS